MGKYKICPSCQIHNNPVNIECEKCGADLSSEFIADDAVPVVVQQPNTTEAFVRVCGCGTQNPPQARKCQSCKEDISDIQPISITTHHANISLVSVDGACSLDLTEETYVIGREQYLKEYLIDKGYVSRKHARLTIVGDSLYIENLSNVNFTYVNNSKISDQHPYLLKEGDEIGLGGCCIDSIRQPLAAYFIVKVNACS